MSSCCRTMGFWRKCEDCSRYAMIDSGYGHCEKNPPTMVKRLRGLLKVAEWSVGFPVVAWCFSGCGCYEKRKEP